MHRAPLTTLAIQLAKRPPFSTQRLHRADPTDRVSRRPSPTGSPLRLVRDRVRRDASSVPVTSIMAPELTALAPGTPVAVARELLSQHGVHAAPVVDCGGRPLGIVSRGDLVRAAGQPGCDDQPIEEVMTCFVFAVPWRASAARAAALMAYEGVHSCVVTGSTGCVIGMVTALDIARWAAAGNVSPGCEDLEMLA